MTHDCGVHVSVYLHGHFKLIQPLLLQLSGLKKEFEAVVPLLVSHVEAIAPLLKVSKKTAIKLNVFFLLNANAPMHIYMYRKELTTAKLNTVMIILLWMHAVFFSGGWQSG